MGLSPPCGFAIVSRCTRGVGAMLMLCGCVASKAPPVDGSKPQQDVSAEEERLETEADAAQRWCRESGKCFVSMVRLLAVPERYDGMVLRTVGYATFGFENNFLFLHQEDARRGVYINALSLSSPPKLEGGGVGPEEGLYVLVEGRFTASDETTSRMGRPVASLSNITRIQEVDEVGPEPQEPP